MTPSPTQPGSSIVLMERDYMTMYLAGLFGVGDAPLFGRLQYAPSIAKSEIMTHSRLEERLQGMHDAGFLDRREQASYRSNGPKTFLYFLTTKGAKALADYYFGGDVSKVPWRKVNKDSEDSFFRHLWELVEVRVAFMYAAAHHPYEAEIVTYTDDSQLKRLHSKDRMNIRLRSGHLLKNTVLIPDAFFHLRIKRPSKREGVQFRIHDYRFFEELDRGTQIGMSNVPERNSWEIKILRYIKYYEDENLYKKRYETTAGRTLVITASLARLERLREITRKAGGDDRFWFTTIDQIRECVDLQTWQLWGEVQCRAWANLSNRNWEHLSKEELKKEVTKQVRIESKKLNWFNPKENNTPPLVPNLKSILTEPIWQKAGEDGWFTLFKD